MKNAMMILILAMSLGGCLTSPLLNHADADELKDAHHSEAVGCALQLGKSSLCASLEWVREPSDDAYGEFVLRFWTPETGTEHGPYVNPAHTVAVKLWMASMGHGSAPVKVEQAADSSGDPVAGVYRATQVYFTMPGDWEIWIQLKQGKTVVDQAKIDYEL